MNFSKPTRFLASISVLLTGFFLLSLPAAAQDIVISGVAITDEDMAAQIGSAIAVVDGRQGLDAETRAAVIQLLRDAETQLQSRINADAMAEQFAAALDTAPAETVALRAELDGQPPVPATPESLGIDDNVTLAELQQWLAKETTDLTEIDSQVAELKAQVETQLLRPTAVRERISQLQTSRAELAASTEDPAVVGEEQLLRDARKLASRLRRAAQGSEINKLEQELLSNTVRVNLLRASRDVAASTQAELKQRTDLLRTAVSRLQQAAEIEAQQAAIAAELAAADKHPVVRALAEKNAALAKDLPKGAADIQKADTQIAAIRIKTQSIERRLARSRQHIEIGGLSRITGRLIVEERRNLPQVNRHRSRSDEMAEVGLGLMYIQEQRRELAQLEVRAREEMAGVTAAAMGDEEFASIRSEVRHLLLTRRDLLVQAESSYRAYLQLLGELDIAQRRLLDSAEEYEEFLNQSLLWIPTAPIAFTGSWDDLTSAAKWAASLASWQDTLVVLGESIVSRKVIALIFVLLLGSLLFARSPLAAMYAAMSQRVGRLSTDSIGLTIGSIAIAVVRALPAPLLLAGLSWFFAGASNGTPFSDALARGLSATAPFLLYTLVLRNLSSPEGVFQTHFGWTADNVALMRRQLGKLAIIGTPLVLVTVFVFVSEDAIDNTNLGRFLFIPLMVFLATLSHPIMHPDTGLPAAYYKRQPDTWVSRLRWTWYSTAVGVPLLLAVVSILGNVYTSTILAGLFVESAWLAFALIIVNMVVLRWLALSRRKLALKIVLQKREAQLAEREAEADPNAESEIPVPAAEPLDLDTVDLQSRKLLLSGLVFIAAIAGWSIWSEVLPVFNLLENVSLWSQIITVDGVETVAPVTLADLFLAILIVIASTIAARNLPGFVAIAIPQRMNVEPGSRYAIVTLVRYFIIMVGTVVVLNIVGWNWSQIQWLVAALSVGLGFGLQEIVANFVSGLVILFERPVRVGDTVTVGQLTGTVSRIRIRATTITDWDRKEIIVPNKSFITEQVVNWTLTDPITRVVIPISVSYGSDVGLVHKIISDTLPTLPLVLDDPAPRVFFSSFGDSSLDFVAHVFSQQLSDRMPLIDSVHNAILAALREHGIEIPYPQRDLHIFDHQKASPKD